MKNKFVVYTALFGDYDDLIDPKENYEGCDFICFTDQKHLKSDIWEIRIVENIDLPLNMMNRRYKILSHLFLSDYEWSMYVDANIKILNNPFDLATKYLTKHDFVMPKHFARDCVYDEAKECVILGKSKYDETNKQMNFYREQGFPKNFGLGENNILFREHNSEKVIKIMNDWWGELNSQTKRDQLSLAYVIWKNGEKFNFMNKSARGNNFFRIKLHETTKKNKNIVTLYLLEHINNCPNGYLSKIVKSIKKLIKNEK